MHSTDGETYGSDKLNLRLQPYTILGKLTLVSLFPQILHWDLPYPSQFWVCFWKSLHFGPRNSVLSKDGLLKGEQILPVVEKKCMCYLISMGRWQGSKVVRVRWSSTNKRYCNGKQWDYTFSGRRFGIKESCSTREKQDEPEAVVWSEDQVFSTEALEDIWIAVLN